MRYNMSIAMNRALYQGPLFKGHAKNMALAVNNFRLEEGAKPTEDESGYTFVERVQRDITRITPLVTKPHRGLIKPSIGTILTGTGTSLVAGLLTNPQIEIQSTLPPNTENLLIAGVTGMVVGISIITNEIFHFFYDGSKLMAANRTAAAVEGIIQEANERDLWRNNSFKDTASNLRLINDGTNYDVEARIKHEIRESKGKSRLYWCSVLVNFDLNAAATMLQLTLSPLTEGALKQEIITHLLSMDPEEVVNILGEGFIISLENRCPTQLRNPLQSLLSIYYLLKSDKDHMLDTCLGRWRAFKKDDQALQMCKQIITQSLYAPHIRKAASFLYLAKPEQARILFHDMANLVQDQERIRVTPEVFFSKTATRAQIVHRALVDLIPSYGPLIPIELDTLNLPGITLNTELAETMLNNGSFINKCTLSDNVSPSRRLINDILNKPTIREEFGFLEMDLNDKAFEPLVSFIGSTNNRAQRIEALHALEKYLKKIGPEGINFDELMKTGDGATMQPAYLISSAALHKLEETADIDTLLVLLRCYDLVDEQRTDQIAEKCLMNAIRRQDYESIKALSLFFVRERRDPEKSENRLLKVITKNEFAPYLTPISIIVGKNKNAAQLIADNLVAALEQEYLHPGQTGYVSEEWTTAAIDTLAAYSTVNPYLATTSLLRILNLIPQMLTSQHTYRVLVRENDQLVKTIATLTILIASGGAAFKDIVESFDATIREINNSEYTPATIREETTFIVERIDEHNARLEAEKGGEK